MYAPKVCSACKNATDLSLCVFYIPFSVVQDLRKSSSQSAPTPTNNIFANTPALPDSPETSEVFVICKVCEIGIQHDRSVFLYFFYFFYSCR
jgi:hypothetical protein